MQTVLHDTSVRGFVFGLADGAGAVDTPTLHLAAEAAGFTPTKLRLGLRRLVDAGLVAIDGRGRQATIALTPTGLAEREPDMVWVGAAYRMDAGLDPWDGRWHLAAFEVPEANRAARDALRQRITELFGGALGGGLYVSPFPWEPWLDAVAADHGIGDRLTVVQTDRLRHRGSADQRTVAHTIWPVAEIDAGYRTFIADWAPLAAAPPTDPYEAIHLAFAAADRFERVFRTDPLLPPELLADDFAGPRARRLFLEVLAAMGDHDLVADADLFSTYRRSVDDALAAPADRFWSAAYASTATR